MANSPVEEGSYIVSYKITSNGKSIPDTFGVTNISISQEINTIASAQITLRDGNASDQLFRITDEKTFEPGAKIEISLGYNGKNEPVFSGIVITQSIQIGDSGTTLQVSCKDTLIEVTKSRSNLMLLEKKDSDAMNEIVKTLKVANKITATEVIHDSIVQYNATDWDFIVNKAELNGMVVVTDKGTLVVAKPPVDDPILGLKYGRDILEMDTKIEASDQFKDVSGNSWNVETQKLEKVEAKEPSLNKQGDLSIANLDNVLSATNKMNLGAPISQEAAQARTDATMLKYRLSRFQGSVSFQGSAKAKPNTLITLEGLGDRFDGNTYVSGVSHSFSDGQWKTEVAIGLSKEWFSEKVATSTGSKAMGNLEGVQGLLTAKVMAIYAEKEAAFRVQLQIPVMNSNEQTVWARLATFYASNSFGAFFYPEVGDEVVVGFMGGDTSFPVILGSLYSKTLAPPVPIKDANNYIKTLMTKSKLQFQFDDENIVMTLLTPNKNTIVISDKDKGITITDENKNQIQMNADGITIESKSDMTIKAAKSLTIDGSSVTLKGKTVDISGTPINLN